MAATKKQQLRLFTRTGITLMLGDAEGVTIREIMYFLSRGEACVETVDQGDAPPEPTYRHENVPPATGNIQVKDDTSAGKGKRTSRSAPFPSHESRSRDAAVAEEAAPA